LKPVGLVQRLAAIWRSGYIYEINKAVNSCSGNLTTDDRTTNIVVAVTVATIKTVEFNLHFGSMAFS